MLLRTLPNTLLVILVLCLSTCNGRSPEAKLTSMLRLVFRNTRELDAAEMLCNVGSALGLPLLVAVTCCLVNTRASV